MAFRVGQGRGYTIGLERCVSRIGRCSHRKQGRSETATDMLSSVKVPKQRHLFQVECMSLRNIHMLPNVVFIRR
jgi:hypothetical protein